MSNEHRVPPIPRTQYKTVPHFEEEVVTLRIFRCCPGWTTKVGEFCSVMLRPSQAWLGVSGYRLN